MISQFLQRVSSTAGVLQNYLTVIEHVALLLASGTCVRPKVWIQWMFALELSNIR